MRNIKKGKRMKNKHKLDTLRNSLVGIGENKFPSFLFFM